LGGTISRKSFEGVLRFLAEHYTPVSLQQVLSSFEGQMLPPRPVLVTFDDAYVSIREVAAPLCRQFGVPALFFINAACLDNRQLALDNLICYVVNVFGLDMINAAIRSVRGGGSAEVRSLKEVFARFLPRTSLSDRATFQSVLLQLSRIDQSSLALEAGLYLSSQHLREFASFNFEIGNHTYTHVICRSLMREEFAKEIDQNRMVLEAISGRKVRSFSVPYGSAADFSSELLVHLQQSGYEAAFLAEGQSNSLRTDCWHLNRVSVGAGSDAGVFSEIEILPRLRTFRRKLFTHSPWEPDISLLKCLHLEGEGDNVQ